MKAAVGGTQAFEVIGGECRIHGLGMGGHLRDRAGGGVQRRQSRGLRFQQRPHLVHLSHASGIDPGHAHAAVRFVHQQSLGHQFKRRFAGGRGAQVQVGHQLVLFQGLARHIATQHDRVHDLGDGQLALGPVQVGVFSR